MKGRTTTYLGWRDVVVIWAVILAPLAACAHGGTPTYELLIEQSPARAGTVTPNSGTYRFSADSTVALRAEPQPGYQFAYWLGDVANPEAPRTTVTVNAPKVVVAVFRPAEKRRFEDGPRTGGGGLGPGALIPTVTDLSAPGWSSSGGAGAQTVAVPVPVPVVVTPEPSTILLLGLGTLVLRRRHR